MPRKLNTVRITELANKQGMIFLGNSASGARGTYSFQLKCGHITDKQVSQVYRGSVGCSICIENKLQFEAMQVDAKCIGEADNKNANYRKYEFSCGHITDKITISIRQGYAKCLICLDKKLKKEAVDIGLTLLGNSQNGDKHYRSYKFKCGCIIDKQTSSLRNSIPRCSVHNPLEYFLCKSFLYGIKFKHSSGYEFIKIGIAKDLIKRIKNYGIADNMMYEILFTKEFTDRTDSTRFESELHRNFNEYVLNKNEAKKYLTKSGFTECYPLNIITNITQYIREKMVQPI